MHLLPHALELREVVRLRLLKLQLYTGLDIQLAVDSFVQVSVFFFQTENIGQNKAFCLFEATYSGTVIDDLLEVKHGQIRLIVDLKALIIRYQM